MTKRARRGMTAAGIGAVMALFSGAALAGALGPRVPDPIPAVIQHGNITIGLQPVASGLVGPVSATHDGDDADTLYVTEQTGKIWAISIDEGGHDDDDADRAGGDRRAAAPRLLADLGPSMVKLGCFGLNYDERGLFGLAFHPDFEDNGLLYTFTAEAGLNGGLCGSFPNHDNVVTEWRASGASGSHGEDWVIDPASRREVLRMTHPQFNHNGGELRFGPDRYLYVSTGDGGAADDQGPGHSPQGNAQDLSNLLGKILRIDPNAGSKAPGYSIPKDNPYVGQSGNRAEIWAHGFRNPYKMSFDHKGNLWVADVGQNDIEEVSIVTRGGNYGWPVKEGSFAFNQNGALAGFVTADPISGPYIDPVAQYDHCVGPVAAGLVGPCPKREGIAVVGGFVYPRDGDVKALRGKYVFGEYSQGFFESTGRLLYLDGSTVKELRINTGKPLGMGVLGIGQDEEGELYLLAKSGAVPGNTGIVDPANRSGVVLRIVAG